MSEAQKDSIQNINESTSNVKQSARGASQSIAQRSSERFHPLVELTLARVRDFLREPEAVFWVFIFPVILTVALGIAFRNTAPEKNRVAIESSSVNDVKAAELARSISQSPDLQAVVMSSEEAAQALRTGRVALIVRGQGSGIGDQGDASAAPHSTSAEVNAELSSAADSLPPAFDYRYDPTRPESRTARLAVDDALQRAFGRKDVVSAREVTQTEPGARYIDWLIPGLVGLNLMGSGMWGLGFAVVYARMRKLLKRFAATPMRRSHYLFSFMLSRLIFLVLEVAAIIGFAWIAFSVAVHGSLINLLIIAVVGGLMFSGIGLLVASRPKTIEGVSGLMNLAMVPMWLLSGTFFSYTRFPEVLQPFIKALPLTALNDSLRAVMSDGAALQSTWMHLSIMLAWGLVSFALALKLFRWQ
ncbi:MAG TPA: ABC transporter permease [Blastocatellia bacterium]|nr:ABC transporter permease [Blastocatellia bacterium]